MPNAINDVGEWLRQHGLGQYAKVFTDHHIDCTLLSELTEGDLEQLGLSLGHRKILRKALDAEGRLPVTARDFRGEANHPSQREAEHRHMTVLFCDMVESTQLSERLEPEDLQILIAAYREACGAAIKRYGGWVARYM
ncbi:adenylate/guanylate cyclase domain-containing protein, partial [Pseudorhodoplanes sp.]|uniref:adenylate/guanylate cyclase domain-containing protein n=1 Tax=Pseudorhodoplanes sp. TaxID=1934341 RepID=UPI0039C9AA49